jgi:hypothetical protein
VLLDENGKEITGPGEGYLVFSRPWPGMMRTLFGNHDRFETTYFKKFPGYYCTGDGKYLHTEFNKSSTLYSNNCSPNVISLYLNFINLLQISAEF